MHPAVFSPELCAETGDWRHGAMACQLQSEPAPAQPAPPVAPVQPAVRAGAEHAEIEEGGDIEKTFKT